MPKIPTPELGAARAADDQARELTGKVTLKREAKIAEIARLEAERDDLALDVVTDVPGAQQRYDELDEQATKAKAELKILEDGLARADRIAKAAEAQRRVMERRQIRKQARRLKHEQAKAAKAVVKGLEIARDGMKNMQELGARVAAVLPNLPMVDWLLLAPRGIKQAVEGEIWRQAFVDGKAGHYVDDDHQWPAGRKPAAEMTGKRPSAGVPESAQLLDLEALVKRSALDVDDILAERKTVQGTPGIRAGEPFDSLDDEKENSDD